MLASYRHRFIPRIPMVRHWKPTRGLTALAFSIAPLTIPHSLSAHEIQLAQAGHEHHPGMVVPSKKDKAPIKKKSPKPSKKHPPSHKPGAAQPAAHQHGRTAHEGHGAGSMGMAH